MDTMVIIKQSTCVVKPILEQNTSYLSCNLITLYIHIHYHICNNIYPINKQNNQRIIF